MSDGTHGTGRRGRPWLKIALFASLAVNLLVVGAVAGIAAFQPGRDAEGPPRIRDRTLFPLVAMLPREDRRVVHREVKAGSDGGGQNWRRDRSELLNELRAEPFDPDRFAARLAKRRAARSAEIEELERVLAAHIATMPAEKRQDYASRVERLGWHGRSGR